MRDINPGHNVCDTVPDYAEEVIEECIAEAWRNFDNGDAHTPADVAADIAQRLVDCYNVVTYPREGI